MLDYIITFQLGYSLDKVYQVGNPAERTSHDSTRPIWNQLQFLKTSPVCKPLTNFHVVKS